MTFTPRAWKDYPDPEANVSAADMIDLESRVYSAAVADAAEANPVIPQLRTQDQTARVLHYTNALENQDWTNVVYSNYDIITLHDWSDDERLNLIKAASPETLVLAYSNFLFAGVPGADACLLDVAVVRAMDGLATTDGTAEIQNPSAPGNQRLIDPGKPGVAELLASELAARFVANPLWDGVFLDDVNVAYAEGWTAIPVIHTYSNVTQWGYAIQHAMEVVKRANRGKLLIPNLGDWYDVPTQADRIALVCDGACMERFAQDNNRTAQSAAKTTNTVNSIKALTAANKIFYGIVQNVNKLTDTQSMKYALGYLHVVAKPGYFVLGTAEQGDYGDPEPPEPLLGVDIGRPVTVAGTPGVTTDVRTLRKYLIRVNPNGAVVDGVAALTSIWTPR